jgi:putative ABC transport system permease protein
MRQDLIYAIRTLRRSPGFTVVALLTLALGIGATSAIFTIVYSVLLRPLPFKDPSRLYSVLSGRFGSVPDPDFLAYQKASTIEGLAAYFGGPVTMIGASEPAMLSGRTVTSRFWAALGVEAKLGRVFFENEDDAVVLSDRIWRSHFKADRKVLGKQISLNGRSYNIVGVMPPEFDFPQNADLWFPFRPDPLNHHAATLQTFARFRPGVTTAQVEAEFTAIAKGFNWGSPRSLRVISLRELLVKNVKLSLTVFMGAVGFLLLIACVNIANLVVARGASRAGEFATRAALGASRRRIVRQLVTESVLLSLAGGAIGFLFGIWGQASLTSLAPAGLLPRSAEIRVDASVFAFTVAISILTGIVFGLFPAIQVSRADLNRSMKRGAESRLRGALVIVEISLAVIVLAGAGLLIRSFVALRSTPTGFESQSVLDMHLVFAPNVYQTGQQLHDFHSAMIARIAAMPGIDAAGAVNWLPMGNFATFGDFYAEGQSEHIGHFDVIKSGISEDYFRAMGIHLLRGRFFDAHDDPRSLPVAIIGKSVAGRAWPGGDPLGKRITLEDHPAPGDWLTVVGLVDDVKHIDLRRLQLPAVYQPLSQVKRDSFLSNFNYVIRTHADPRRIAALLRSTIRELDPNQPIERIATMDELLDRSVAEPRFQSTVLGAFAGFPVGIYGMMAYSVAARRREIGIRVALGATPGDVRTLILSRSAVLLLIGLTIGIAGALALTRVLANLLFEIKTTDPVTLVSVIAILAAAGIAATLFPARAAARVDPAIALRHE